MSAQALSVHVPHEEAMVALGAALGAAVGKAEGFSLREAEGTLSVEAEGSLSGKAEGSLSGKAEGSLSGKAEGSLSGKAEGSLSGKAEGSASKKAHGNADAQGLVIFLEGELGMGKTTLARGFARALGHHGAVKSPTYTIVEPYELASTTLYHFDLYRLDDPEELELMGIRDYFGENSVCLVEWPARGLGVLPRADIVVTIMSEGSGRCLGLEAATDRGRSVLQQLEMTEG